MDYLIFSGSRTEISKSFLGWPDFCVGTWVGSCTGVFCSPVHPCSDKEVLD